MGYLKNEPLPERLPEWTPFRDISHEMVHLPGAIVSNDAKTYVNSRYMVIVERTPQGDGTVQVYLSIKDLWRSARHDWRDLQKIKNELVGEEQMMIEIYPPESRLLDTANQFHLWGVHSADGSPMYLPIGFDYRHVTEGTGHGEVQRPFEPHVRPKDLEQHMAFARELHAQHPYNTARLVKVGRNEQCPCGSNRKFKKCCGRVG